VADNETLTLRATVIAGKRYQDDFTVIWRGLSRHPVRGSAGCRAESRITHNRRRPDHALGK
jgi:hypothetical protein